MTSFGETAGEVARQVFLGAVDQCRGGAILSRAVSLVGDRLDVAGEVVDLRGFDRVWVCGAWKASLDMAFALSQILGDQVVGGIVVTKAPLPDRQSTENLPFEVFAAEHPVPDEVSLRAGRDMLELGQTLTSRDLVLFALSGGASALMEDLVEPLKLADLQATNSVLLSSGWSISQINDVRKRLSTLKNGGLARAFGAAHVECLVLSDVIGDDLASIGSGPFVSSKLAPLGELPSGLPSPVLEVLQRPHRQDPAAFVRHTVLANALYAAKCAAGLARARGFEVTVDDQAFDSEAAPLGRAWGSAVMEMPPGSIRIAYGESVVRVDGAHGKGGRAQEAALAAAIEISGCEGVAVLVAGTDGTDGPTEMAGAVVNGSTAAGREELATECLTRHDSYLFHAQAATHLKTGPTGTNLNELGILVRMP